jgi:nucleotide-binding universal stress UspA family protein
MRTLLVPTDFSKLSRNGITYAIELARRIDARVIVLSIVTEVTADRNAQPNIKKYQESMVATAKSDGEKLLKDFKTQAGKVALSFEAAAGFPVANIIEQFAVKNKVNMIVMSSKGATGLKKIMMGSNATAIIDKSSIPVLVVPADASTKAVNKLVYATDTKDFQKEVKIVASFAEMLGAAMEVVHVVPEERNKKSELSDKKVKELAAYPKIHLHVMYDKDVARGLESFINNQKEDFVLTTFTHRLSFNEKLFGKSVTQKLAYHNTVPLLVVNKSNQKG